MRAKAEILFALLILTACGQGQKGESVQANDATLSAESPDASASSSAANSQVPEPSPSAAPSSSPAHEAPARSADDIESEPTLSPSFSCSGSLDRTEHMVCANPDLALRDRRLSRLYHAALATVLPKARPGIRTDQRQFLSKRGGCNDAACVASAYDARIATLSDIQYALAEQWSDASYQDFDPSDHEISRYESKAFDRCQAKAVSTVDMTDCNAAQIKRLTAELHRTFQRTLDRIDTDGPLKDSENRWGPKLDDYCEAQAKQQFGNGTAASIGFGTCKIDQTIRRIIWLRSGVGREDDTE